MRALITAWLLRARYDDCIQEADRKFPLETGGVFMGYWHSRSDVVITELIGPGPLADHGHHHFEPEQKWQLAKISTHYERSGRRETYLGDWHSHPGASTGRLSFTDRRVLRRIIKTPQARAKMPLMAIFFGGVEGWKQEMWCAQLVPRHLLWPKLNVNSVQLRLY